MANSLKVEFPVRFRQPERLSGGPASFRASRSAPASSSTTCRCCSAASSRPPTTCRRSSRCAASGTSRNTRALETERFILRHNITTFKPNPFFPVNTLMLMRGAVAAQFEGVFEPISSAAYHHMWEEPKKMDDLETFRSAFSFIRHRHRQADRPRAAGRRQEEADRQHHRCRGPRRVRFADLLRRRRNVLRQGSAARRRGIDRRADRRGASAKRERPAVRAAVSLETASCRFESRLRKRISWPVHSTAFACSI